MKTPRRPDPEKLHALAAQMRAWALSLASYLLQFVGGWLGRALKREITRMVREGEHDVRRLVLMLAMAHTDFPGVHPRTTRPRSIPPGFRRARPPAPGADLRLLLRGVRLRDARGRRGALCGRIARLRAMLASLGPQIARMKARIVRVGVVAGLTAVAPPASPVRALAQPSVSGADTS